MVPVSPAGCPVPPAEVAVAVARPKAKGRPVVPASPGGGVGSSGGPPQGVGMPGKAPGGPVGCTVPGGGSSGGPSQGSGGPGKPPGMPGPGGMPANPPKPPGADPFGNSAAPAASSTPGTFGDWATYTGANDGFRPNSLARRRSRSATRKPERSSRPSASPTRMVGRSPPSFKRPQAQLARRT